MTRVRMGMVGGGEGGFIGRIHRLAAALDGEVELVCGAFSADPERSRRSGAAWGLDPARVYPDWQVLLAAEAARPAAERAEFIAVVTPNHLHLPVAAAALEAGFAVFCEKPATRDLAEARALAEVVAASGRPFALAHTYAGYPLVHEARARIAAGELGRVRRVVVEYQQGWLAADPGGEPWRLDPARSGPSGCLADIGVHAFHLAEFVTGLEVAELAADLAAVVPGRRVEDDAAVLLRFAGGARGVLLASQVSPGEENGLRIRVYGERAGLEWFQEAPNTLWLKGNDRPAARLTAGGPWLGKVARALTRTPPGHPEGYIEAFANLYRAFAAAVRAGGRHAPPEAAWLPGIREAVRGMAFVDAALASSRAGGAWRALPADLAEEKTP
ncbi:MAG: oxidoreductase [Porticoccaceae bacterium]|nr:MAG: oxidoreductase [Porticoccaceae bacterium]